MSKRDDSPEAVARRWLTREEHAGLPMTLEGLERESIIAIATNLITAERRRAVRLLRGTRVVVSRYDRHLTSAALEGAIGAILGTRSRKGKGVVKDAS